MSKAITRERIDELLAFLPVFEDTSRSWIKHWIGGETLPDGAITMAHPVYSAIVERFFSLAGRPCWSD
jgi:hypothetical protein